MSLSERLARLRTIQAAAAATKAEQHNQQRDTAPLGSLRLRLKYLRLRELRGWLMTDAQMSEYRCVTREDENDRADERANDWTR